MFAGILLALSASVCWALANVAIQRSGRAVGALRALLWAQLAGGVGFAALAWAVDSPTEPVTARTAAWALGGGMASLLAYVGLFVAFEQGRLSFTVPVMSCWSAIAAGVSIGILGERVTGPQLFGAGLVLAGVVLVAAGGDHTPESGGDATQDKRRQRRALVASFAAAIGFGFAIPAIDQLGPATGRIGAVSVVFGVDILLGLPLALFFRVDLRPPPLSRWALVCSAGLFETLGFACVSLAGAYAPVSVLSPTASLGASLTVLYAWLVLRERPPRVAAIGTVLACSGIVVLSL